MIEQAAVNECNPHHFVWRWPTEGSGRPVGVCDLCGAVTTADRDAAERAALLALADEWDEESGPGYRHPHAIQLRDAIGAWS